MNKWNSMMLIAPCAHAKKINATSELFIQILVRLLTLAFFVAVHSRTYAQGREDCSHYIKAMIDQAEGIRRYDVLIDQRNVTSPEQEKDSKDFRRRESRSQKRVIVDLDKQQYLVVSLSTSMSPQNTVELMRDGENQLTLMFFDRESGYDRTFPHVATAVKSDYARALYARKVPMLGFGGFGGTNPGLMYPDLKKNATIYRERIGPSSICVRKGSLIDVSFRQSNKFPVAETGKELVVDSEYLFRIDPMSYSVTEAFSYPNFDSEDLRQNLHAKYTYKNQNGVRLMATASNEYPTKLRNGDRTKAALVKTVETFTYDWLQVNNDNFQFPNAGKLLNDEKAVRELVEPNKP